MRNLILYKKGEISWIRWIKKRIAHNLNFICLFQGATGIGKTWSAISLAQMIDPDFNIDQIVFDFKELMQVINSDWFKKKKWKILIFDEPQITISNRQWQSTTNKLMNYLLSTFRHQNIILIFCSPYVDFLDSQSMKLLHCIFQCEGVNRKTELSRVRPKIQQYNSYMKKMYQHPLYVIRGKKVIPLRDWYIPKPTPEIIELYEQKKTQFTDNLNQDIKKKIKELSGEKEEEQTLEDRRRSEIYGYALRGRKPLTEKQKRVMEVFASIKGNKKYEEASKILGITFNALLQHKKLAEKKGYTIQEFKKDE